MFLYEILSLVLIHWIADFVCQNDWQALNKSKQWEPLLSHTAIYSVVYFVPICILMGLRYGPDMGIALSFAFLGITFTAHTITDFYTSRANTLLLQEESKHRFFVGIGFDQLLHYTQIFITYHALLKAG